MKMMKKEKEQNTGFLNTRRQILNESSSFSVKEAYKTLRTNIRFSLQDKSCKRISITSASAGEGKSITLLNLAISVAEDGHKVLLIDADLRRPALARLLVEQPAPGLSNVLAGLESVEEAVRTGLYPNLDIIFSGDVPPNPLELLGGDKMRELIADMSKKYDYILVDTPPVNVVSDANIVTSLLDGVLLLVRQGSSRKDSVKRAVSNLALTGIKPLGFVLNGVDLETQKSYGYGYGYGYGTKK
jgi:capsular exopolysaccharide synthesis family protein